jgi:hypothetical protein
MFVAIDRSLYRIVSGLYASCDSVMLKTGHAIHSGHLVRVRLDCMVFDGRVLKVRECCGDCCSSGMLQRQKLSYSRGDERVNILL